MARMTGGRRGALLLAALAVAPALLAAPPPADGRVALVASGTRELPLIDVSTDRVVARIALPAPGRAGRRQR